jgi:hypothetical protein
MRRQRLTADLGPEGIMTKPRTLILAIATTAVAFALALGSVISDATLDPSPGEAATGKRRQVALAAAPLEHATPGS